MLAVLSSIPAVPTLDKKLADKNQLERQRYLTSVFFDTLPKKPYCTNKLSNGLVIRPRSQALRKSHIQFNDQSFVRWMVFDVDHDQGAWAWDTGGMKPPHFAVTNPKNGHSHLWYGLKTPVCKTENARLSPLKYLAAVEYSYTKWLSADPGYAGLVSKNPLHPSHGLIVFKPLHQLYSLADLCLDPLTPTKVAQVELVQGLGRNCSLFDTARKWAYTAVRGVRDMRDKEVFKSGLQEILIGLNSSFQHPLPDSELRAIRESIFKYCIRHDKEAEQAFIERQAEKGRKSGAVRREGSIAESKPWEEEGVSRATWYRKQK